jgi:hypothetical protein
VPVGLSSAAVRALGWVRYLLLSTTAESVSYLALAGIAAVQINQRGTGRGVPHSIHQFPERGTGFSGKHVPSMTQVMKVQARQTGLAGGLDPYPAAPKTVAQWLAGRAGEDQRIIIGLGETVQMRAEVG